MSYRDWEKSDGGQIFTGWLMILLGAGCLLWLSFGGLDDVVDTPRGLLALIVAPFLVVLGFWKLSGAEDDDE